MKKWILRIVGIIVVLIVSAIIYVELNKEKLVAFAVEEANKSIDGSITYQDAEVSIFRSFPNLRISLHEIVIRDAMMKEPIALVQLKVFSIDINLIAAIKKDIIINAFSMKDGIIYVANYKDGTNNYTLLPEEPSNQGNQAVDFDIKQFRVEGINLVYKDELSQSMYKLEDFHTAGQLTYKGGYIDIANDFGGLTIIEIAHLLPSYKLSLSGSMRNRINPDMDSIAIQDGQFLLNDLPVNINGSISIKETTGYVIDFNSPSTEIKRLVSILPNFYKNQYESLIGTGTYILSGSLQGNTAYPYPTYKISLMAKDGSLRYPQLRTQIDKFSFGLSAENTSHATPYTSLIINDIDIASGSNQLQGSFVTRPQGILHQVGVDMTADIDLEDAARSLVLPLNTQIRGKIQGTLVGNANINAEASKIRANDERFSIDLAINDINYTDGTMSYGLKEGLMKGDKEAIDFSLIDINYLDAIKMTVQGNLQAPLQIALLPDQIIQGAIEIKADNLDLNKLEVTGSDDSTSIMMQLPATDIDYVFTANQIQQGSHILHKVRANGNLKEKGTTVDFAVQEFNGSNIHGHGTLDRVLSYGMNNDTLTGKITVVSDRLDINRFMGLQEDDQLAPSTSDQPLIPANIKLDIDYQAAQIGFKNIDITKTLGQVSIKDQKIIFENKGNIFGGEVGLSGTFQSAQGDGYLLDMKLELKELQFSRTAASLRLFQQLLPIAKLLEGKYTASLSWNSELSKDYIPDLNTLTAYGVIQTEDGGIKSTLPIDSLIRKLNIIGEDRQPLKIANAKKYFIVEDGKVMIQDLDLTKGDIGIRLSGSHSFAQALDYKLLIDIPKSKLKADEVLNFLQDKVKFSNLLKNAGQDVSIQVVGHMGGSTLHPKFSVQGINLKKGDVIENIEDKIVSTVTGIKDSIENTLKDTIGGLVDKGTDAIDSVNTKINEIKMEAQAQLDSTKKAIEIEAQREKEKIKEEGGKILTDILNGNNDSTKVKIDDIFKERQGKLDSLSKKIPFKKLFGN